MQAQDMGKVGAIQDLLRGIDKIMGSGSGVAERPQETTTVQVSGGGANTVALLKRGSMALEDGEWENAKGFFDRVLDIDAESAQAYLGLAMAHAECQTEEAFQELYTSTAWKDDKNTARAKQYATPELQKKFERWDAEKAEKAAAAAKIAAMIAKTKEEIAAGFKAAAERAAKDEARRIKMKPVYAQCRKRSALAAQRICLGKDWDEDKSNYFVVGLNVDGTVFAAGPNRCGQCDVDGWTDIVAVAAGACYTVGLKSDGTVIAVGYNGDGRCNVSGWTGIAATLTLIQKAGMILMERNRLCKLNKGSA